MFKKTFTLLGNETLGTSYSETTNLLDLKLWQQEVLMSTPCCRSLRSNRSVVSEYEVPKVWFPKSAQVFLGHPLSSKWFIGEKGSAMFFYPQTHHHVIIELVPN